MHEVASFIALWGGLATALGAAFLTGVCHEQTQQRKRNISARCRNR